MTKNIKNHFHDLWKRVSKVEAMPQKKLSKDESNLLDIIFCDLNLFARSNELLVSSEQLGAEPILFHGNKFNQILNIHRDKLEFIALHPSNPHQYWAITEEEYKYYIFYKS